VDLLKQLLTEIRSGKSHFQPKGPDDGAIREFQLTAKALAHAHEKGLIG